MRLSQALHAVIKTLITTIFVCLYPLFAQADNYKKIDWQDLIPKQTAQKAITGTAEHGQLPEAAGQAVAETVPELNNKPVSIAGFIVPLEGDEKGITQFLLVPYMGACVHVPPPPANQIIYVITAEPMSPDLVYDPIVVSGLLRTQSISNEMAESGYSLKADAIAPYEYR